MVQSPETGMDIFVNSEQDQRVAGLVSIVMPAYNAARFIRQAVASVLAQSHGHWELLIVDDCSSDETWELARELAAGDVRIKVLRQPVNSGAAATRNAALDASRGQYLAFLDADDMWLPHKLEQQLTYMANTGAAIVCSGYYKMDEYGTQSKQAIVPPARVTYASMLNTSSLACLTVIYDAARIGVHRFPDLQASAHSLALRLGLVARRLGSEDYACWLLMLRAQSGATAVAHGLPEPLALYRVVGGSLSGNKLRSACFQWHIYRHVIGLGLIRSLFSMARYAYFGYRKYRV